MSQPRSLLTVLLAIAAIGIAGPAVACLWDQDTMKSEVEGLTDVDIVAIITGRFERQPPKYYELRLARVTASLADHPENLAAYDDAAVACDRLGRHDEAIAFMASKQGQLDQLDASDPRVKEQQYRCLANLGTFWVHRWFAQGADRSKLDEVRKAHELIAQAITLNPNAHFGREKYQLMAMELLLREPVEVDAESQAVRKLPSLLPLALGDYAGSDEHEKLLAEAGVPDAVQGLSGLIALGNAWESIDVYYALGLALQVDGRSSLAYLCQLRIDELLQAGRHSMAPGDFTLAEVKQASERLGESLEDIRLPGLQDYYKQARHSADEWQTNRWQFMERQFADGRHPDLTADFWNGWQAEPAAPEYPAYGVTPHGGVLSPIVLHDPTFGIVARLLGAGLFIAIGIAFWRWRAGRASAAA